MTDYEALVLPSQGKAYENYDPNKVKIRPLLGKDEMILAEISSNNLDKKFNVLINNVTQGLNANKLTLGDRKYILVWLAMKTYGSLYPVELICDTCLEKINPQIDMRDFKLKMVPDDFQQPYELTLSDDKKIYLRLMTVEDEIKATEWEKNFGNAWLYRFAQVMVDQEMDMKAKMDFLGELPGPDFQKVKAFHEKFDHGPNMKAKYECPKCGGDGLVAVPFRIEMVLPHGEALRRNYEDAI